MPPRPLPDELIEEVLLRVRADDPASLVRAALACRRWCRLVADPGFRRRRLQRHGATPPMLGFVGECERDDTWTRDGDGDGQPFARFVPMSTCCPRSADHRGLRPLDARHGRVLLQDRHRRDSFVVWDPVTGHRAAIPAPPRWPSLGDDDDGVTATVLCAAAATATGTCDHLDCHRGPFMVVLVGTDGSKMFTCTYSSESMAWSDPSYEDRPGEVVLLGRSALVGTTLCLKLRTNRSRRILILKYDLCTQETSTVRLPHVRPKNVSIQVELTTLEDGRLGFVRVEASNKLSLWSRDDDEGRNGNQVAGWTLRSAIDLKRLFPLVDSLDFKHRLVGVVEGACCIAFMAVQKRGLFIIDMKTRLMSKVSEDFGTACCVVPYFDFCTPALRAPPYGEDDESVGSRDE